MLKINSELSKELFKLLVDYRNSLSTIAGAKDTILDKLACFLTENSWRLYARNDIFTASEVHSLLSNRRIKPLLDKLYSYAANGITDEEINQFISEMVEMIKFANTNVMDKIDPRKRVNEFILQDIIKEVCNIISDNSNEAPTLTEYIRSSIFTDEDRKALSEEATDLWVVAMIQAHYRFVLDLLDDSVVPNSMKDIANLAQFIYACIGEGQSKREISDIARSITKKSNNENVNDVDFGGGYTESKPEFILMDKNHHNRCFHFERDKTNEYKYYILQFEVKVFYEDMDKDYIVRKHIILDEDGIRKNILYVYKNILYMIIGDKLYDIAVMDDKILGYSVRVYKSTANYISEKFKNSDILSDNNAFEYMEYIEFKKD